MQQVNLYRPELRITREWLTSQTLAISVVCFIFFLAGLSTLDRYKLHRFEQDIIELENRKVVVQMQIDKIKSVPRVSDENALNIKLNSLREKIVKSRTISDIIDSREFGNEQGFSEVLIGIAKHSNEFISLERILFSSGGTFLEAKGNVSFPEYVPNYIQALKSEDSFLNVRFGNLSIAASENKAIHEFSIGLEGVYGVEKSQVVNTY